jgi:hypothetical protein
MKRQIYLDYSATTPVDPRVAAKIMECLTFDGNFGNPASRSHSYGWMAEEAVETARQQVAELVNADPREIVWTSGATESNNLAIKGAAHFYHSKGKHIVTSKIEHKAVLDTCRQLEREGFEVTYLDPEQGTGMITPDGGSGAAPGHHPGVADACEQRDRHHYRYRRHWRADAQPQAYCCMSMPPSPPASCPLTWPTPRST